MQINFMDYLHGHLKYELSGVQSMSFIEMYGFHQEITSPMCSLLEVFWQDQVEKLNIFFLLPVSSLGFAKQFLQQTL